MSHEWESERIIKLRERLELSQEQFAQRIGVSVRTVSRWETGESRPGSSVVIRQLDELADSSDADQEKNI